MSQSFSILILPPPFFFLYLFCEIKLTNIQVCLLFGSEEIFIKTLFGKYNVDISCLLTCCQYDVSTWAAMSFVP